ncbi:hypothetical protein [Desulfosudis oleivorans]|uniref:hypothetical protein n=1 Tax=Desulfosudis oleivorans TaxID=181663 RepID=UPI00129464C9|nr:hypothetical protein [Desulfosudis oleivorans]
MKIFDIDIIIIFKRLWLILSVLTKDKPYLSFKGMRSILYQKLSPSGRADCTAPALLQHAGSSSLQLRVLRLAFAANSTREITGIGG